MSGQIYVMDSKEVDKRYGLGSGSSNYGSGCSQCRECYGNACNKKEYGIEGLLSKYK